MLGVDAGQGVSTPVKAFVCRGQVPDQGIDYKNHHRLGCMSVCVRVNMSSVVRAVCQETASSGC